MVVEVPSPTLDGELLAMQGVVPKLSATPGVIREGGPLLGQHNEEIWGAQLGAAQLSRLEERGII